MPRILFFLSLPLFIFAYDQARTCDLEKLSSVGANDTLKACYEESQKQGRVYLGTWIDQQRPLCEQIIDYNLTHGPTYEECVSNIIEFSQEVLTCESSYERQREAIHFDRQRMGEYLEQKGEVPIPLSIQKKFHQLTRVADQNFSPLFRAHNWKLRGFQSQAINAQAGAGGSISLSQAAWSTEGGLPESEIAAILAHEIGHVNLEHSLQLGCLALEWFGHNKSIPVAGAVFHEDFTPGMPRRNSWEKMSQDFELEADKFAVRLLSYAGYDPRAMAWALESLTPDNKGTGIMSGSHPEMQRRISRALALAESQMRYSSRSQ